MLNITRKATGKLVGRKVTEDTLELFLSVLPAGVYSVEDLAGNELDLITVKGGRIIRKEFAHESTH
jgi:hypothetical protein